VADTRRPFVAIVGGLRFLDADPKAKAAAKETAKIIGAALAKAGCGLVVYYSDEQSLEPYVVSGYVAANPVGEELIWVRYANSQVGQVHFPEQDARRVLFKVDPLPDDDWEVPFYRSLAEEGGVDGVLLLGGSNAVLIAGQIALARGLPILAVNTFKGSAEKVWRQLKYAGRPTLPWEDHSAETLVRGLKEQCEQTLKKREEQRSMVEQAAQTIAKSESQNVKAAYASLSFVVLVGMIVFGFSANVTPIILTYSITMLVAVFAAGTTGAMVRSILWNSRETAPHISATLGGIAGAVVGLAYLIPQWVSAPGLFNNTKPALDAADRIQLAYAVLVAISAGLGFDTVFNRLQTQAANVPIGPSKS